MTLSGRIDIRIVRDLQQKLGEAIETELPVVINCDAVDWMDTACMQAVLAAHCAAPDRVALTVCSESTVHEWLKLSGFAAELGVA